MPKQIYGSKTDLEMPDNRRRWVNSGVIIGKSSAMLKLYTDVHKFVKIWYNYYGTLPKGDQGVFAAFFAANVEMDYGMKLDYWNTVSQSVVFDLDVSRSNQDQLYYSRAINTKASIVHFPGEKGKKLMAQYFPGNPWVTSLPAGDPKGKLAYIDTLSAKLEEENIMRVHNQTGLLSSPLRRCCVGVEE